MSIRVEPDQKTPTAAIELTIRNPLPDYDLEVVEADVPRDVDPMLASQGFQDLVDEARAILATTITQRNLEIAQLTGAICSNGSTHRPGIWLVLREKNAPPGAPMSPAAQAQVAEIASELNTRLQ